MTHLMYSKFILFPVRSHGRSTKTYQHRDIPTADRPRERLELLGESSLTDSELLAILLRVGVEGENAVLLAQRIINEFGGLQGLHQARFEDLCAVKGVGRAKAAQIKAAIALGYRLSLEESNPNRYSANRRMSSSAWGMTCRSKARRNYGCWLFPRATGLSASSCFTSAP